MREVQAKLNEDIQLGRRGENLATCVTFDVSEWQKAGEGTVHLLHQRNGDEAPYPCNITVDKGVATWVVTASDVAVAGRGRAELQYLDGEVCMKSATYSTNTLRALADAGETPPAPIEGWVRKTLSAAAKALESAKAALTSEINSKASEDAAMAAKAAAEKARDDTQAVAAGEIVRPEELDAHNTSPDAHADIREALETAGCLLVTVTNGVADKRMTDIRDAYKAGKQVYLSDGGDYAYRLGRLYYNSSAKVKVDNVTYYGAWYAYFTASYGSYVKGLYVYGPLTASAAGRVVDSDAMALLPKSGGTMTGALTLSGDPTSAKHAATKQYVDNAVKTASGPLIVTVTDGVADKTMGEMWEAHQAGTPICAIHDGDFYWLQDYFHTTSPLYMAGAVFARVSAGSKVVTVYQLHITGNSDSEYGAAHAEETTVYSTNVSWGTEDLVDGVSELADGALYFVIEE
jgi:methylmalonyl-CoA mutase cobalamin-binding subunit